MTLPEFGLLLISVIASSLGQFCLKFGAGQLGQVTEENRLWHRGDFLYFAAHPRQAQCGRSLRFFDLPCLGAHGLFLL